MTQVPFPKKVEIYLGIKLPFPVVVCLFLWHLQIQNSLPMIRYF